MKVAIVTLKSISPYSQSRAHETEKLNRETPDEFEKRTWREKCHVNSAGHITIPAMAFKQSLDKAASMLGMKVPGKRAATYTKFFLSGVMVLEPLALPVKKADVKPERVPLQRRRQARQRHAGVAHFPDRARVAGEGSFRHSCRRNRRGRVHP